MLQHYMILFKENDVFAEMEALTATERAVQRREVIHNTTGLARGAPRQRVTQRDAREAAEVVCHALALRGVTIH